MAISVVSHPENSKVSLDEKTKKIREIEDDCKRKTHQFVQNYISDLIRVSMSKDLSREETRRILLIGRERFVSENFSEDEEYVAARRFWNRLLPKDLTPF